MFFIVAEHLLLHLEHCRRLLHFRLGQAISWTLYKQTQKQTHSRWRKKNGGGCLFHIKRILHSMRLKGEKYLEDNCGARELCPADS